MIRLIANNRRVWLANSSLSSIGDDPGGLDKVCEARSGREIQEAEYEPKPSAMWPGESWIDRKGSETTLSISVKSLSGLDHPLWIIGTTHKLGGRALTLEIF